MRTTTITSRIGVVAKLLGAAALAAAALAAAPLVAGTETVLITGANSGLADTGQFWRYDGVPEKW